MQSIDSMIEVLQAYKEGKKIEWKGELDRKWTDFPMNNSGPWDFYEFEYRVKKEPLVKWAAVNQFGNVAMWDNEKAVINKWINKRFNTYHLVKFVEDSEHESQ